MRSSIRIMTLALASALIVLSLTPLSVKAQTAAATECSDPNFGTDFGAAFTTASQALSSSSPKISDLGPAYLAIAKLRAQYEDMTAPTGCEAARLTLLQIGSLDGD